MSFVPNRDLKRLNPMSNDWRNSQQVAKYAEPRYHDILRYNGLEK